MTLCQVSDRLILNAILIKYAGIVVNVGEHDKSRDEYINTARESRELGGHPLPKNNVERRAC